MAATISTTVASSASANTAPITNTKPRNKDIYFNNVANIVCLFWFNDKSILDQVFANNSKSQQQQSPNKLATTLSKLSIASPEFKQYIVRVLNQTQLPPTAVSLALLYILRLKQAATSPLIGSQHSEYRIFSVAMILANKFLDDNTYTNKTWSDITRLPLREISAMEVEFLTNMRYSLVVSEQQWVRWQQQLKTWLNVAHQAQYRQYKQQVHHYQAPTPVPTSPYPITPVPVVAQVLPQPQQIVPPPPPPPSQVQAPLQMPTPPQVSPAAISHKNSKKRSYDQHENSNSAHYNHPPPAKRYIPSPSSAYNSPYAPLYPVKTLLAPQFANYQFAGQQSLPPPPPPQLPFSFAFDRDLRYLPPHAYAPSY